MSKSHTIYVIVGFVPLTIAAWPEGDQWVSHVLELDIASVGTDADNAFEQAMDAVCSYLNTLEALGEREMVFAERSLAVYTSPPASVRLAELPRDVADRRHKIGA